MKQGFLTHDRVCPLLSKGHSCYTKRAGERRCKSVWQRIIDANMNVLNLVAVNNNKNENNNNNNNINNNNNNRADIPGLTDNTVY